MARLTPDRWGYRTIVEDIRAQIRDGRLKPGDQLKSRRELAEHYSDHAGRPVSETTIGSALRVLADAGDTEGVQGVGVYVKGGGQGGAPAT